MRARSIAEFDALAEKTILNESAATLDRIFKLKQFYTFDNQSEVTAYLMRHFDLIPILEELSAKVFSYLPDSKLYLNVETDPEIADSITLYTWVVPPIEPEDAYNKLLSFKYDWWFDASSEIRGKLFVALDYR